MIKSDCYRFFTIVFMLLFCIQGVDGQDFLTTRNVTLKKSSKGMSYEANVEFPTEGDARVVSGVVEWLGGILDTDDDFGRDYQRMLLASSDSFFLSGQGGNRTILVERTYEDGHVVTFESMVTDKNGEVWRWADCASFSKRDGHRITVDEIFQCDEEQIQRLMWEYRGDLPLDASGPDQLIAVNAGYIDGWVIVIGPAHHYRGAPFRLRYEEIEQYLNFNQNGYYIY